MRPTEAPRDDEVASLLDAVLETRPDVDGGRCSAALDLLCRARDAAADETRRGRFSLLISLVMGVKHPLGEPPWDALAAARARAFA